MEPGRSLPHGRVFGGTREARSEFPSLAQDAPRGCRSPPDGTLPFPAADALRRAPAALRTLHALPPFPVAPFNTTCTFLLSKGSALDGFLQKFRAANIWPEHDLEGLLTQCARLAAAFSSLDQDLAPSHNDLFKPDNILFDGSRLRLRDWEAAFQNDRYADLAVVANMLVANEADEPGVLIGKGSPHVQIEGLQCRW